MIHPVNKKPITIQRGVHGGAFTFPLDRKDEVHAVLDRHGVPYWDEGAFSADGGPWLTTISLSAKADMALVQRLLDELP